MFVRTLNQLTAGIVVIGVRVVTEEVLTADIVRAEPRDYERRFRMSSSEFQRRFQAGELHEHEMLDWEFYCDAARELGVEIV